MRPALRLLMAAAATGLLAPPAFGDVAYPARLDVEETALGVYEVTFTLPIVAGRKLRAEPSMPPTCQDVTARQVSLSSAGETTTWTTRCEPASLAGEAILVQGLLGTQTDLAFTLTTLEGRVYAEILRPSRPGFLVPEPPSTLGLAAEAAVAGVRRTLRQLPLWLLLVMATLMGVRGRGLAAGAIAFAVTHALGQWLAGNGWLGVARPERDFFVLATIAVPAVALAGAGDGWRGWVRPLWPGTAFLGVLYGGATPQALPPDGLSHLELHLALGFFAVGVALGLFLMARAAVALDVLLRLAGGHGHQPGGGWRHRGGRWLGYGVGALAAGLLLAGITAALPEGRRDAPLDLLLLAAVLGPSVAAARRTGPGTDLSFAALAGLGAVGGLLGLPTPLGSTLTVGCLLLLGAALAVNRALSARWVLAIGAVAVPAHAWSVTEQLVENVSRSTGAAVGAVVLATGVFYASRAVSRGVGNGALPLAARLLGTGVAVVALVTRLVEYRDWFDGQLATEFALGLLRLPVLALLLATLALVVWPRRRRVVDELGLRRRTRKAHWLLLGAAWLVLPHGTVALGNPLFEPHAPRGDAARRVVSRVLSDTYHAFNLADENELYDRLADSVTGDLVDDLYLDSRRRLTAGTREGAQVTVRDVEVLHIGDPRGNGSRATGLDYACRWLVTARVQHLQHVHHRRNLYNGVLTLRAEGQRWKIVAVELHSEDREVVR